MKISGQVFDSEGQTIPSANVTIKTGPNAGKFGSITDDNGKFSLDSSIIQADSIFEISYLGYVSQTWTALALQNKPITLLDGIEHLKEVVVTAGKPKTTTPAADTTTDSPVKAHLKKYKTVYIGGGLLAGLLTIFSSIKK